LRWRTHRRCFWSVVELERVLQLTKNAHLLNFRHSLSRVCRTKASIPFCQVQNQDELHHSEVDLSKHWSHSTSNGNFTNPKSYASLSPLVLFFLNICIEKRCHPTKNKTYGMPIFGCIHLCFFYTQVPTGTFQCLHTLTAIIHVKTPVIFINKIICAYIALSLVGQFAKKLQKMLNMFKLWPFRDQTNTINLWKGLFKHLWSLNWQWTNKAIEN